MPACWRAGGSFGSLPDHGEATDSTVVLEEGTGRMVGKVLLNLMALGVGVYAVVAYAFRPLGSMVHPLMQANFQAHPVGIYTHVFASAVALVLGPFQFSARLRQKDIVAHRRWGSVYLMGVLVGGLAGLFMARFAFGGLPSGLGFGLLAVLWIYTGVRGTVSIARGDAEGHRRWMVRNFALTFAAVTLRIYLPASIASGLDFVRSYTVIAWLCWVPNLVVAELWFNRQGDKSRVLPRVATD